MMKKQLNRMLQLANPNAARSENSELLSEDLFQFENRIEPTRRATSITHKRLLACLQGQPGCEIQKRVKKMPLMSLSQSMLESCRELDIESPIRKVMELCSSVENGLATVLLEHEIQLEKEVLDPLFKLSEEELPNTLKHKKQLAKMTLDWTAAKNRLSQAMKSGNTGAVVQSMTTKVDVLKEEVEEIWRRVEQSKDEYAADLYHFASKEEEYSNYFCLLLEAQADYHRKSLKALDGLLPMLRNNSNTSGDSLENPAFGQPLEEHLKCCGREIALPIEACVMMLLDKGMTEEGLFRLAAAASVLKRLKSALDRGSFDPQEFNSDSHAVAGALKSYLRELPQPLMTFDLYEEWFQAASEKDLSKKVESLREICAKLPPESYNNFRYLIKFLAKLADYQQVNKMSPSNIAIVLGPNLLWPRDEGKVSMMDMASASSVQVVSVIEPIIQNADSIFPEELDFSASGMFGPTCLSSTSSPSKERCPVEPAQTIPPPTEEIAVQKEELTNTHPAPLPGGANGESPSIPPSSSPPPTSGPVEARPAEIGFNVTLSTIGQTSSFSVKKVKKPALTRPTFPPPQQPKASLPWTSNPVCASLTLPADEKGIIARRVSAAPACGAPINPPPAASLALPADEKGIITRRATACAIRAPAMAPPPVPAPRAHQRAASLDSPFAEEAPPQGKPEASTRSPQRVAAEMLPYQPRCCQVGWNQQPQPTPRSRVSSISQPAVPSGNSEVNGSSSGEQCGSQEQLPPEATEGVKEQS
ncbi:SH3 domain-binding protein 1-like isoform X2 [Scyliorhinus canicula]|uniref:SH3 domain-binding protein 1-like isoform X2 n=1 Tax=Scyliorhinus canicula TaxID=7830 RepID=UPI0018F295E1|nr:SH3 domain-binding protein 1-like isoform X2 [Scyliorhinus canicula]